MEETFAARINVTEYQPPDKHRVIFETFRSLEPGSKMELINDHDPKPLYYQFEMEQAGKFTWKYLEKGPEIWRVSIGKV